MEGAEADARGARRVLVERDGSKRVPIVNIWSRFWLRCAKIFFEN